jgi:hypothetical protein
MEKEIKILIGREYISCLQKYHYRSRFTNKENLRLTPDSKMILVPRILESDTTLINNMMSYNIFLFQDLIDSMDELKKMLFTIQKNKGCTQLKDIFSREELLQIINGTYSDLSYHKRTRLIKSNIFPLLKGHFKNISYNIRNDNIITIASSADDTTQNSKKLEKVKRLMFDNNYIDLKSVQYATKILTYSLSLENNYYTKQIWVNYNTVNFNSTLFTKSLEETIKDLTNILNPPQ